MKKLKVALVLAICFLFFGCNKTQDNTSNKEIKQIKQEKLLKQLQNVSIKYTSIDKHHKRLGTYSGFCLDVCGAVGGVESSAWSLNPWIMGGWGLAMGIGASMAMYMPPPNPLLPTQWAGFQKFGAAGDPNVSWGILIAKYPNLIGKNPYAMMGVFHNYSLDYTTTFHNLQEFTPKATIDYVITDTKTYFDNNPQYVNFDYSTVEGGRDALLAAENVIVNVDFKNPNIDVAIFDNMVNANIIKDLDFADIMRSYLSTVKSIDNLADFAEYTNQFEEIIMSSDVDQLSKDKALICLAIGRYSYVYWSAK